MLRAIQQYVAEPAFKPKTVWHLLLTTKLDFHSQNESKIHSKLQCGRQPHPDQEIQ